MDETGLFWRQLPDYTLADVINEKKVKGFKVCKDRLTILLGSNATGDFKMKPLVIGRAENPHSFRGKGKGTDIFPVLWRSNKTAWMTTDFFAQWLKDHFIKEVQAYMQKHKIPRTAKVRVSRADRLSV